VTSWPVARSHPGLAAELAAQAVTVGGRAAGRAVIFLQGMPLYFIQSIVVHLDLDQVLV
jgi:hypothetical protein